MKLKNLGEKHVKVQIMTDSRYKPYKANEDRIILKDGLLFRKDSGETDSVNYCQIRMPKQLVNKIPAACLHGDFGKHLGISKTIIAYREKFLFPKLAQ